MLRDDGVEVTKLLELKTTVGPSTVQVTLPSDKLTYPNWHLSSIGIKAQVMPGTQPSRLLHAIQNLSDPTISITYAHTGWRKIGEDYYFLNANRPIGPIGPLGPLPEVEVELPRQLSVCSFPAPPTGEGLQEAATVMLEVLEVADIQVTFTLLLTVIRAAIGDADFSIFVEGITGVRKTAVVAMFQAFFGAGFDARNLPASWSSTANAIEELLFIAKDMATVIDDYVPANGSDRGILDSKADRVFRGSANGCGRQRLNRDGTPRPERPSRCLAIATGEVLPQNLSVLARVIVLEITPGSVNLPRLTGLQRSAAEGQLALAMSGFIQWLASRLDDVRLRLKQGSESLRVELHQHSWHGRTASSIAELMATSEILADFLVDARALTPNQRAGLVSDARDALIDVGEAQGQAQRESDPVDQFIQLLVSVLSSGRAHLCCSDYPDNPPTNAEQLAGWHRSSHRSSDWLSRGRKIGWLSPNGDVYLNPGATEAEVQTLARDQGTTVQIGSSLRKRLNARGFLASVEQRGRTLRLVVRKTIGKGRHDVMHMHTETLWPDCLRAQKVAQVAQSDVGPLREDSSAGPLPNQEWPNGAINATRSGPIESTSDQDVASQTLEGQR